MKNPNNIKTSKINVSSHPNAETKTKQQPCLCEVAELVLFLGRYSGIMPITRGKKYGHIGTCSFKLSKYWQRYGYVLQVFFTVYVLIMHGIRLGCGPTISNTKFWYVMSIGYALGDLDAVSCIIGGTFCAERICKILETMATLDGSIKEIIALKGFMKKFMILRCICYLTSFCSYLYVAFLRTFADTLFFDNNCNLPDYPFAVAGRGFSLIFPEIQHLIVAFLCLDIKNKFKQLSEKTDFTLALCSNPLANAIPHSIDQLAQDHKQISSYLKETNTCFGLQLLISTTSLLFTTIYFLYRYSISSREMVFSNTNERLHYITGTLYRMANLLYYMYLGSQITYWSQEPLRVLQTSDLLNLPFKTQQQVQTLLLQWSGQIGFLSALGVINLGPWLLAPIVGSVITYLLVAIQFENNISEFYDNATIPVLSEALL